MKMFLEKGFVIGGAVGAGIYCMFNSHNVYGYIDYDGHSCIHKWLLKGLLNTLQTNDNTKMPFIKTGETIVINMPI